MGPVGPSDHTEFNSLISIEVAIWLRDFDRCVWIVFPVGPGTNKSALKSDQFFQGHHRWIGQRKLIGIDIQLDGIVCL